MKRVLSVLLAVLMLLSVAPVSAFAEGDVVWNYPTFVVGSREVAPGEVFDVPVSIENNPGIVSFIWQINYEDYAMELLKVTPLQYTSIVVSSMEDNPITFIWNEDTLKQECFDEGEVLLLTFRVREDAAPGEYPLSLYYDPANVFNGAFESVRFNVHNGWITVQSTECNHEYDYPCAAECYLCGAIREVEHAWVLISATEPTCSSNGVYRYRCDLCGEPYMEAIPATGKHEYDNDADPDCNNCGEKREVEVHVHEWLEKDSQQPTCTTDGWTKLYCPGCGVMTRETIPAFGHAYDDDFDADCNNCGEKRDVEECPHKYTVKVLMAATCAKGGLKRYTCVMCGDSYEESTPSTGEHAYDDDADPDCNNCGEVREVEGDVVVGECQHAYKNPDAPVCALCGESLSLPEGITVYGVADNAVLTRGDEFTLSVMLKNNPGLVGWRVYVDYDTNVLEPVAQTRGTLFPASGITFGKLGKTPANAMFNDSIAEEDYEGDGLLFSLTFRVKEDAVFGACLLDVYLKSVKDFFDLNWSSFEVETVDAAIVVDDHTHAYDGICDGECNICGFTRPAAEHSYDNACDGVCNGCGLLREVKPHPYTVTVVDPTCEDAGIKTSVCAICGDTVTETIPALGHDYKAAVTAPTCTTDGYTTHTCARCGDSYVDSTVAALGHKPGAPADCLNPQTCTACGIELNPALGHDYKAAVTAPTCTADGYTTHTCQNCGDSYVDSTVAALGHRYDNACDATCNTCGDVREVPDHVYDHKYDATCNECGAVREIPFIPGDVDDNGEINVRDYGLLQQWLNEFDVVINELAADVTGDGEINVRDYGLLQQYLNDYDVTLGG